MLILKQTVSSEPFKTLVDAERPSVWGRSGNSVASLRKRLLKGAKRSCYSVFSIPSLPNVILCSLIENLKKRKSYKLPKKDVVLASDVFLPRTVLFVSAVLAQLFFLE